MRTTITLDADTAALLEQVMSERGLTFKQAVNDAIRAGLRPPAPAEHFQTRTARLGRPTVNLDKALALAGELEDEELLRKQRLGK